MGKNIEFTKVQLERPGKNVFDLSHDIKLSGNMGTLIPVLCLECIPGDKHKIYCEALVRLAPMLAPMMHKVNVFFHTWFVPTRIAWKNWEKFIVDEAVGSPAAVPAFPYVTVENGTPPHIAWTYGSLLDYMGVPDPSQNSVPGIVAETISAIPFMVYYLTWYHGYRDQNMQEFENPFELVDGNNTASWSGAEGFGDIQNRAWEHDYFTSCLPDPQKGASVDIPLGLVELLPDSFSSATSDPLPTFRLDDGTVPAAGGLRIQDFAGRNGIIEEGDVTNALAYDPAGTLGVSATTINDLRTAFALQRWFERNARGGTRYIEHILAHFGVRSSDKRLQRPEFISGSITPITISEVLNTTSDGTTPQGDMTGHGIALSKGGYGSYFCEEHGYILTLMSVMPKTAYQQGLEKMWLKTQDFTQYYFPSFAHLGEEAVLNREVYAYTADGGDEFGYLPRYSDYKYKSNRVAGDFRKDLDYWHMGRIFTAPPGLDAEFIVSDPTHRVFAVTDPEQHKLWMHVALSIRSVRPIPKFSTPGGI